MTKIKVAHIIEGFTGGLVTYMLSVLPELVKSGKDVTLIYSDKRADPDCMDSIQYLKNAGVNTVKLPLKREITIADYFVFFELVRILKRNQFDIVHTHCAKAGFLGRFAAKMVDIKGICYSPHCFVSNRTPSGLKARIYIGLEKIAALFTHKMIFVSESERFFALKHNICSPEKSEIAGNGLALNKIETEKGFECTDSMTNGKFCITFAGRLVKYKNPDIFIQAAILLKNKDVKFMLCGEGPESETLQKLVIEHGLEEQVCFAGYIKDMSGIYRDTDIFVMCSDAEGHPYALLEAMAYGCCCIGTKVDGVADIIEDGRTGLLCEKTAIGISNAVQKLIHDDELRDSISQNAKDYIISNHSLEKQVSVIDKIYNHILLEVQ